MAIQSLGLRPRGTRPAGILVGGQLCGCAKGSSVIPDACTGTLGEPGTDDGMCARTLLSADGVGGGSRCFTGGGNPGGAGDTTTPTGGGS